MTSWLAIGSQPSPRYLTNNRISDDQSPMRALQAGHEPYVKKPLTLGRWMLASGPPVNCEKRCFFSPKEPKPAEGGQRAYFKASGQWKFIWRTRTLSSDVPVYLPVWLETSIQIYHVKESFVQQACSQVRSGTYIQEPKPSKNTSFVALGLHQVHPSLFL